MNMVRRTAEVDVPGAAIERLDLRPVSAEIEIPPEFLPRKYAFEHTFADLPLRAINMLSQVRHDRNDQQTNLSQSIEEVGLKSFPEIARFDDEHYLAYARVIADRNGVEAIDEELFNWVTRHEDGFIYVLAAGHSRIIGIHDNEENRAQRAWAAGYSVDPLAAEVRLVVRDNPSPAQMMLDQITENLHSRPAAEHIAADVLALYKHMAQIGDISSDKEFFELFGNKLPESTFSTIMNFAYLPPALQKLAFEDKQFPFVIAARIGALAPHKRALETFKIAKASDKKVRLTRARQQKVDKLVDAYVTDRFYELARLIHAPKRFGINLQVQRLENEKKSLIDALANEGVALFGTSLEDWAMTPEQLIDEEIKVLRANARKAVDSIIKSPIGHYDSVADAYGQLVDVDTNPSSIRSRDERLREIMAPVIARTGLAGEVNLELKQD